MRRGEFEGEAFTRMSRRVARGEYQAAHFEAIACLHPCDARAGRQCCCGNPCRLRAFCREVCGDGVMRHEALNPADEVCVYVRLGNSDDAMPSFASDINVSIDVTGGIDDDRLVRFVAADDV